MKTGFTCCFSHPADGNRFDRPIQQRLLASPQMKKKFPCGSSCAAFLWIAWASLNAWGADVRVNLTSWPRPAHISVRVGDTVTWHNDRVESTFLTGFDGSWKTETIPPGGTGSHRFDTPGFQAYYADGFRESVRMWEFIGSVSVLPDTGSPRRIFLAAPVVGQFLVKPDASFIQPILLVPGIDVPTNEVSRVEFYSGAELLGSSDTPPYVVGISNIIGGEHALMARLIQTNGIAIDSDRVNVTVVDRSVSAKVFSFVHVLKAGEVMFYFIPLATYRNQIHSTSDFTNWERIFTITYPATLIDTSTTNSSRRFYRLLQPNPP